MPGQRTKSAELHCNPFAQTFHPPPPPSPPHHSPPRPPPQAYPPLVEARGQGGTGGSLSALAVFRGLSEEQWQRFMDYVRAHVAAKLRCGAWKQAAASKGGAPMFSCPRF